MQAELFILRLSRNSGVLGLAGMPFTSQIFPTHTHSYNKVPANHGILLVRPLLEFSKDDMYKVGVTYVFISALITLLHLLPLDCLLNNLNYFCFFISTDMPRGK